jgi:threonine/homoserine/homoserine lactone efflux protein
VIDSPYQQLNYRTKVIAGKTGVKMAEIMALTGILGALLIGAISPGPSFVLVSRVAVASSRNEALFASLGMGVGGALFACMALLGLATLLNEVPWLYLGLRIIGGGYLVYLGWRIWITAKQPFDAPAQQSRTNTFTTVPAARSHPRTKAFVLGLVTQVSNPKTAIVYASIFASLMPADPSLWMLYAIPPLVFAVEAGWYALVAHLFSRRRAKLTYLRSKTWIDRTAGFVLASLGGKLIADSIRP